MYIPSSNAERDLPTLFAFVEAHPFGVLVTNTASEGLVATHLPLVLDRTSGPMGTLRGHLARANHHVRGLTDGAGESLVILTGPDAYISPEWYATRQETGRVVPTWNYVAVHAYGLPRLCDDPESLRAHLDALTRQHESTRPNPWRVSDAPAEFIAQQMKAIIGVELPIDRIEGKWKMSQNRSAADIDGVVRALGESESANDRAVAAIVQERRPPRS